MYRRDFVVVAAALTTITACAASVDTEQTTTIVAVVETVDPVSRELLLRGDAGAQSGRLVSMLVSPRVQRLNEVHPGDHVRVTYYQALAAQVVNVFSGPAQPSMQASTLSIAGSAERPGGLATRVRHGRVVITAVDHATNTVSFVGPSNVVQTVSPKNEEVRRLIQQLKVGDQVDVVYEEALAITVEPMQS
jgi:hypothetical protein